MCTAVSVIIAKYGPTRVSVVVPGGQKLAGFWVIQPSLFCRSSQHRRTRSRLGAWVPVQGAMGSRRVKRIAREARANWYCSTRSRKCSTTPSFMPVGSPWWAGTV